MNGRFFSVRKYPEHGERSIAQQSVEKARRSVFDLLYGMAQDYEQDFFLVATFPRGETSSLSANYILSNWPEDLLDSYNGTETFSSSLMVTRLQETILPVVSHGCAFSKAGAGVNTNGIAAMFSEAGLQSSISFSLHDADLRHYLVVFSGTRQDIGERESMEMLASLMKLLDCHFRQIHDQDGPSERLTIREIECLRWSAAGKSSEEIAIILDLSSHTVASYLKGAMRKLNAVNRMQAVARAYRFRLL